MRRKQGCPAWGENGVGRLECDPVGVREQMIGSRTVDRKRRDLNAEVAEGIDLSEDEGVRNCRIQGTQVGDLHNRSGLRMVLCSRHLDHCRLRSQSCAASSSASGSGASDIGDREVKFVAPGSGTGSTVAAPQKCSQSYLSRMLSGAPRPLI